MPPPTIQYDQLELSSSSESIELIKKLCNAINRPWRNDVYDRLASMRNVNYLTTNYDLTIESYFPNVKHIGAEVFYNLYSYSSPEAGASSLYSQNNVWHIHGDVRRLNSIILGYDHYCKEISQIRSYLPQCISQFIRSGWRKIVKQNFDEAEWQSRSWIDLFFTENIYILGLALGFTEIDLWWLIDLWAHCKKQHLVHNEIFYLDAIRNTASSCKPPFVKVLNDYGIQYKSFVEKEFKDAYNRCVDFIESQLI